MSKRNRNTGLKALAAIMSGLFILLAVAGVVAYFSDWFTNWDKFKIEQGEPTEETADGGMLIGESEGVGVSLLSEKIAKADYAANGYADEDAAAQAIIDCFGDHNHYGNAGRSQLAGNLMLNGYGTTPGIVSELVRILTESVNRACIKIEAEYDDNGNLVGLSITPTTVSEAQTMVRSENSLVTYWHSLEDMLPVVCE